MGKNRIFFARWTPAIYWSLVSKPVSQDIQSICYCLHPGIFRLDTRDLLVAVVPISISSKYLYLYLALKVLTNNLKTITLRLKIMTVWRTIETSISQYSIIRSPKNMASKHLRIRHTLYMCSLCKWWVIRDWSCFDQPPIYIEIQK